MCTKNGNQGQESRGQGSQGKMVALYNFSPSSCTYAADCVYMDIISIFSIFAIINYDVILCNVCTHAQQRFLTVTCAKWWLLHAGRNPGTSVN